MISTDQNNRKRRRPVDNNFQLQSKYFVNQRMVDSLNQNYMKKIFDKTVGLLFEGAKNHSNNNQDFGSKTEKLKSIQLDGEGDITYMDGSAEQMYAKSNKNRCKSCDKDAVIQSECSNCNLNLCEFCGVSCVICMQAHVCKHCIHLFESNVHSQPCCSTCKMFS